MRKIVNYFKRYYRKVIWLIRHKIHFFFGFSAINQKNYSYKKFNNRINK